MTPLPWYFLSAAGGCLFSAGIFETSAGLILGGIAIAAAGLAGARQSAE